MSYHVGLSASSLTRLLSDLRQTIFECVYLVSCGHWLHDIDKDVGHNIQSTIAKTLCSMQTLWLYLL